MRIHNADCQAGAKPTANNSPDSFSQLHANISAVDADGPSVVADSSSDADVG